MQLIPKVQPYTEATLYFSGIQITEQLMLLTVMATATQRNHQSQDIVLHIS
jgi:hypothetical protein